MKTLKSILVIGILLMASFVTPVKAQWTEAYFSTASFNGFYFVDSLNGWFTHLGLDRIMHTSDGGYTFEVQATPTGTYGLNDIYMETNHIGWTAGSNNGGPGRILRTTDGGLNWLQLSHPAPNCTWNVITKVGNSIWFGGGYGSNQGILMKTSDNGQSWQVTLYPDFGIIAGITAFDSQNYILNGTGGLLVRTTDGGNSWTSANLPSDYQVERVKFLDPNLGYSLVSDGSVIPCYPHLYSSTDGGFTWNLLYSWSNYAQLRGLSINPQTGTIYVSGDLSRTEVLSGILKSTDGGSSWYTLMEVTSNPLRGIHTPNSRRGWAVGSRIYRYDYVEPAVVQPIPNALIQMSAPFSYQVQASGLGLKYTMSGNPSGLNIGLYSGLIQGTPQQGGNFPITVTVQDTDANVVNTSFNLRINRKPLFIPPWPSTHAWVDSTYQFMLRVEDADDDTVSFTWFSKPNWLVFLTEGITSVVISGVPSVNDTGYHTVSVMADDGYGAQDTLSWQVYVEVYTPINHAPYFIPPWPDTLAYVDSVYDCMLYAEDIDGDSLNFEFMQKPTWLLMLDVVQTSRLQGTPTVADTGYHPVSVTVSDNKGGMDTLSWTIHVLYNPPPVNNLPYFTGSWPDTVKVYRDSTYAWSFLFQDQDGDTLYTMSGAIGVPGLTLLPGQGVGEVTASVVGIPTDIGWYEAVVAVKDEHGAQGSIQFTVHVDFPTSVELNPGTPTEFSLLQNYPNPFNPVTTIRYELPQSSEVSLTVYNLLGQEILVLVNEYQPMGIYEASFDASQLPSGTYFYRLQADKFIQTKKMILLK